MLNRPSPLPEELDRSYLGRIMRANGISKEKEIIEAMLHESSDDGDHRSGTALPSVVLLARMASIDVPTFVRQHTTLPLRRGITSYHPELHHGCESNLKMLHHSAMRLARPGAYFCHQCVEEDEHFHGVSYWRREHQIPGLFWCPKHEIPLYYTEDPNAFLKPPSSFLNRCEFLSEGWAYDARTNESVRRFLAIASDFMSRATPLSAKEAMWILRERAAARGFQLFPNGAKGALLSDAVVESFGREWLATVSPSVADKPLGVLLPQLDGVLFLSKSASSTIGYLLAVSVLFGTVDEALNALQSRTKVVQKRSRAQRLAITDDELKTAYIEAKGSYKTIGSSLGTTYSAVSRRLENLGLPNLSGIRPRVAEAAIAFFIDGKSLDVSATGARIPVGALEDLIRICGVGFARVLREMHAAGGQRNGLRRPLKLTPREVQTAPGRMAFKFRRCQPRQNGKRLEFVNGETQQKENYHVRADLILFRRAD